MSILTIKRKKYGVDIQEVYFRTEDCPEVGCDLRVDFCIPEPGKHYCEMVTSLIDLRTADEGILAGFRKNYRREIISHGDSGEFVLSFTRDPRPQDIQGFCTAYNQFAHQQKLPACNLAKLLFFAGHGALMLSNIRCAQSGHVLCQHAFIGDGLRARLLYSISSFRLYQFSASQRNRIGRAHRLLHWADIRQFKQLGYTWYDLGGMGAGKAPELENIDHFKKGFGGRVFREYVNFSPMNLKGWVAMRYLMGKL